MCKMCSVWETDSPQGVKHDSFAFDWRRLSDFANSDSTVCEENERGELSGETSSCTWMHRRDVRSCSAFSGLASSFASFICCCHLRVCLYFKNKTKRKCLSNNKQNQGSARCKDNVVPSPYNIPTTQNSCRGSERESSEDIEGKLK